ncbi:MAG: hypothetical protein O3A90_14065 [Proteobacteria bacterium]|jgi:hypothetical protein|nr:hypothetical protein [Pseudomonadota bacterium]
MENLYEITITQTVTKVIEVIAASPDEAEQTAHQIFDDEHHDVHFEQDTIEVKQCI